MTLGILLAAMLLDALFGEPKWIWSRIPHPAVAMGRTIKACEKRWNSGPDQLRNGVLLIAGLMASMLVVTLVVRWLPFSVLIEILIVSSLLSQRSLADHVGDVSGGLQANLRSGRDAVAKIVGRDTSNLDEIGVVRGAIESAAENFSDGLVAPVFWYAVGGLPGILIYKMVNTADSTIGYKTENLIDFGWASARLDDLMNWVPARLSGLMMCLMYQSKQALAVMLRDAPLHRSPNAGWPEAAMAAVLEIAVAGPRTYDGKREDFPFVNPEGRKQLTPADIDASVDVMWRSWGGLFLALSGWAMFVAITT
jgi:adenosylcobinamide-phosphate synthase